MKVRYFYDPLCGWCYGFSPVIQQAFETYKLKAAWHIYSGGMITGKRIGQIGVVAPYIKSAYKDVENATGVKFGNAFLKDVLDQGKTVFSSIEPNHAMSVVKRFAPELSFAFGGILHKAIYFDGIAPTNLEAYGPYFEHVGIDAKKGIAALDDAETKAQTQKDWTKTALYGVSGFPTVWVEKPDGKKIQVSEGYLSAQAFDEKLKRALSI